MKEETSYRTKLIKVIVEYYVEDHVYDFVDYNSLHEDLQEKLDLNFKFETKILDIEIVNKHIYLQIWFEDENMSKVLDVTISSNKNLD